MTTKGKTDPNKTARITGLLFLIVFALGLFGEFVGGRGLVEPGDAATTANSIMASEFLFRLGFVTDLLRQTFLILLPLALYKLLKPVNRNIAALMVVFALVSATIGLINMLNQIAALLPLSDTDYATAFEADQLYAQMMLFLDLYGLGSYLGQFLSFWLVLAGYLVFRSGFLPRILGILLMIAGVGYVIDSVTFFLFPDFGVTVSLVTFLGEVLFMLWLLIKGVNVEKWEERALESA